MALYRYTLPSGKKVTLKPLTVEETIQIMDKWGDKFGRAANELAMMTLVDIDGQKVTAHNRHEMWESLSPKERSLITDAYGRIHTPTEDEREDFFASEEIVEG